MSADDIRAAVLAIGPQFSPEVIGAMQAVCGPNALRPTPQVCGVDRDLVYGPDPRHRLDIFNPVAGGAGARPGLVFVHGGGFVAGDKGAPDAPFYNNVGAWAAREGFVGVNLTYRLAPAATWPSGAEDLERAVDWLKAHAADHGLDPDALVMMGHSAGAAHVGSYVARARGRPIAGAMMTSGIYDLRSHRYGSMENVYYGADASLYAEQSSLPGLVRSEIPQLFTLAEFDPPSFHGQAARVVEAWMEAKGFWPRMLFLPEQNHISSIYQLGAPSDGLGGELAAFIRRVSGR